MFGYYRQNIINILIFIQYTKGEVYEIYITSIGFSFN